MNFEPSQLFEELRALRLSVDARARHALLMAWLRGEHAHWRAAAQYLASDRHSVPLAWPDAACPVRVALRNRPPPALPRQPRTPRRALLRRYGAAGSNRGRVDFVCPAVALAQAREACVVALAARQLLAPRLEVVGSGIDTLELHTKCPLAPWWGMRIEGLFDRAQKTGEAEALEVAGVQLELQPRTVKGGWLLRNVNSDVVIRLKPDATEDEAAVLVELHAAALWARGWKDASALACRLLSELSGVADCAPQVTRIDLCVDFQGWTPTLEDRALFVTRARKRGRYLEGHVEPQWDVPEWLERRRRDVRRIADQLGRADSLEEVRRLLEVLDKPPQERAQVVEYDAGALAFTGFAFGHGHHVSSRLYNKSREISVSRKSWFLSVWAKNKAFEIPAGGTVAGKVRCHFDVWRLEFQLRRDALKEFTVDAGGGKWRDLTAWEDCAAHLPALWQWLTTRWLRHGIRTADERCVLSAPWRVLHRAQVGDGAAVEGLEREIAKVGVQPAQGNLAGYATTAVAQAIELEGARAEAPQDYGALMVSVLHAAAARAAEKANESIADLVEAKREKLETRRRFLACRDTSRETARAARDQGQRYATVNGVLVRWEEEDDRRDALSKVWRAERWNRVWTEAAKTLPF